MTSLSHHVDGLFSLFTLFSLNSRWFYVCRSMENDSIQESKPFKFLRTPKMRCSACHLTNLLKWFFDVFILASQKPQRPDLFVTLSMTSPRLLYHLLCRSFFGSVSMAHWFAHSSIKLFVSYFKLSRRRKSWDSSTHLRKKFSPSRSRQATKGNPFVARVYFPPFQLISKSPLRS